MCFHGYLAGYLLGVTRSLYFLNFFNAENHGKRRLNPFQITTPERQGENADLPQSKVSFPVLQRDKTMYKNFGHSRCFLNSQFRCLGDEACFNPVAINRKKTGFSYLSDFLIASLDVF